ncbi:hypothetical protein [Maritalea porphyrae]|uniref:hypothetical protein n=1 Tax=Maritalea porphyrae TaxID=880732 RepID=UPI0022AE86D4|nr:hypothetical protein [Maritalea porphyrae]MCZ4270913.1 hypothetical protein [Maritalea porphyrae]
MTTDKDKARAEEIMSAIDKRSYFIPGYANEPDGETLIATLIADVRNEALEGVYRTMEHRARWASKNHAEPGYIAACRDTLKALDTLKSKKETT